MTLFQPDFFSRAYPIYSDILSPGLRISLSKIFSHYPLVSSQEFSFQSFGELGVNSKNFIFTGPSLSFTVKMLPDTSYIEHCNTCNFISNFDSPFLPTPILSNSNSYALKLDNFTVSLWHHIPGPYFSGSLNNLYSISSVVSRLFSSLRSTSLNPSLPPSNFPLVNIYQTLDIFFNSISLLELPNTIIAPFIPHQRQLSSIFTAFISDYLIPSTQHLVHSDIHPHNILFPPNQLPKLVDVDSISYGYPSISLGFGAFKLYRQSMVFDSTISKKLPFPDFLHSISTEYSPSALISGAYFEIFRRISIILKPYLSGAQSPWINVLPIQLSALLELHSLSSLL